MNSRHLENICSCCRGIHVQTPLQIENRPGLQAVEYRIGHHHHFRQSMQARLSLSDYPILKGLLTRDSDDFTLALLDSWAVVADILTFYQERLANESFLNTATDRFSLVEMAKLIGYRLNPGVSAATHIAFILESMPSATGAAPTTVIERGTRLQSTPGQDQLPQVFETTETITGRLEWNDMQPLQTQQQQLSTSMTSIFLAGTAHRIEEGDRMVVCKNGARTSMRVRQISEFADRGYTRVDFPSPAISPPAYIRPDLETHESVEAFIENYGSHLHLNQVVVDILIAGQWRNQDLATLAELQQWNLQQLQNMINETVTLEAPDDGGEVHVFRKTASLFGYNAPKLISYDDTVPETADEWTDWTSQDGEAVNLVSLEGEHKECRSGGYIYIHCANGSGAASGVYEIDRLAITPRTAYGVSSKSTRLQLTQAWWNPDSTFMTVLRSSQVSLASEQLETSPVPVETVVTNDAITLDRAYLFLAAGQHLVVTGERTDANNTKHSELVRIKEVVLENGRSVVELGDSLKYHYHRDTVVINGNVAPANHGETVNELLGSGDGTKVHQRFQLKQQPLTYSGAATSEGSKSTLQIRVNDVLWQEVESLYGQAPESQVYCIVTNDDGTSWIQFGDGINGARLPSGQNNIRAEYRKGLGNCGNLRSGQVDQLMSRPLGLKSAVNPKAASGGADPETLDELQANAPLTTLTLGRVVSLTDYHNFARSFTGVSKASATWSYYGGRKYILLTVGGPDGATIEDDSKTYTSLLQALHDHGDPYVQIRLSGYRPVSFRLAGNLFVDPSYENERVLAVAKTRLLANFSYNRRDFIQPLFLSEVIEVIQSVDGVLAVDLDTLYRSDQQQALNTRLLADPPHLDKLGTMVGAEMITLDLLCLENLGVLA